MPSYERKSGFAREISEFVAHKVSCGFKATTYLPLLNKFDRFCVERQITAPVFNRDDAEAWEARMGKENTTYHYKRVNIVKHFLAYLLARGYEVFVVRDVRFKASEFLPHIYTDDEVENYFKAVDSYEGNVPIDAVQYPVLFRILYCCGTRIGETLSIRKCDVDLENGVIALKQTKGDKQRYVVVGPDLKVLLRTYAEKRFHEIAEDGLIFSNRKGKKVDHKKIYLAHRHFLRQAGIPYLGAGKGPRLHDWRHHFAIYAFKGMSDNGMDMYVSLPILAAYLGHANIMATERYIRLAVQHFPSIGEKFKDKVKAIFGELKE